MRITLLNQFYPPDHAPTGRYLADWAQHLAARGHRVRVVCSQRGYDGGGPFPARERREGVEIVRVAGRGRDRRRGLGRLLEYLGYLIGVTRILARGRRPDLVVALTTPPFLGLVARWWALARDARHGHWVMDLWPDVLVAARPTGGALRRRAIGLLARWARRQYAGSAAVVTLGPCMQRRARRYRRRAIACVPLWTRLAAPPPAELVAAYRRQRDWSPDTLILGYSGNLGHGHRWEDFAAVAERLGDSGLRWVFCGGGARRPELERWHAEHPTLPVELLPYVPQAQLDRHLAAIDVHLLSVRPGWAGCIVPSKLQNIASIGGALIAVAPPGSASATWVAAAHAGAVISPGDRAGLIAAITALRDPERRQACSAGSRALASAHFDPDACLAELSRAFGL